MAKAADVRPADARVSVSPATISAAPEGVRANARVDASQQSEIVGIPLAALIASIIAALVALGIILDDNKSP
ncbi:hypothetical protein [Novosphingobium album (ex Liu et al. 2023)]|uniref:hypothetical protein n=1 Tax=Novosphingobium album (ex Liu et al. 2023) TaxID=3031130 RepID=UPI0023B18B4F|nr:hypothetical protein [Novosphingobium album (ex Liu et al. 2023)]